MIILEKAHIRNSECTLPRPTAHDPSLLIRRAPSTCCNWPLLIFFGASPTVREHVGK